MATMVAPVVVDKENGVRPLGIHGFADFFSSEVFHLVLHNPTTAYRLQKFSQTHFCGEAMEFLEKVDRYNALVDELIRTMSEIHQVFTSVDAPRQINISDPMMKKIDSNIKKSTLSILPSMELIFAGAEEHVKEVLCTDIYPRFVKYQMTTSAARALANDRQKYQGLGDCFCLTDPSKADNPIVFASDGFVSVTGYSRTDIIPRNCRFLQGRYTDRAAVIRLRDAIAAKEESVELLLNYKKNGDPFWNLLYVAPLFHPDGTVAYYLGGQINCSTTIHSYTDILRILSLSDDPSEEDEQDRPKTSKALKQRKNPFRFLLGDRKYKLDVRETGMEHGLLKKIEKMSLGSQMKLFYTAYSKYLVMSHETMQISFHSRGILELLCGMNPLNTPLVGREIFRFLSEYAIGLPRTFKTDVKRSISAGQAISTTIRLPIRRASAMAPVGEEKYVTHWTPVKDANGDVSFVVMTLSL